MEDGTTGECSATTFIIALLFAVLNTNGALSQPPRPTPRGRNDSSRQLDLREPRRPSRSRGSRGGRKGQRSAGSSHRSEDLVPI